jgi:hypothetical protein
VGGTIGRRGQGRGGEERGGEGRRGEGRRGGERRGGRGEGGGERPVSPTPSPFSSRVVGKDDTWCDKSPLAVRKGAFLYSSPQSPGMRCALAFTASIASMSSASSLKLNSLM